MNSRDKLGKLDKLQVQKAFSRFAGRADTSLSTIAANRLLDRLSDMNLNPPTIVDLGGNGGVVQRFFSGSQVVAVDFALPVLLQERSRFACVADVENLPLASQSVDLVWSNLCLEWVAVPAFIREAVRVLKVGGLLALTTLGPDTLQEMRGVFGAQNRVHNFLDMHDISDLLMQNGLVEPIAEADKIYLRYSTPLHAMQDCRQIGAGCALADRPRGLMGKQQWQTALDSYPTSLVEGERCATSTFELICITAWRPEPTPTHHPIHFY